MKRIIVLLLGLSSILTLFVFAGCANNKLPSEAIKEYSECSQAQMDIYRAIHQETGYNPVIESTYDAEAKSYINVKVNAYLAMGFDKYYIVSQEEYQRIQEYQNRTGIQVIYPTVSHKERPTHPKNQDDAGIYYQVNDLDAGIVRPKLDESGNFIPNYWTYAVGSGKPTIAAEYNSLRIEGENGVNINGENCYYVYGRLLPYGVEVRLFRYAYYEYLKATDPDSCPSEKEFFRLY